MSDCTKVCFILCTNDELYENECFKYLNHLFVPDGMQVEILSVKDAKSMTAGYNEGMNASDAKYKVYLHQDTFIINRNFISDFISVFEMDAQIGLMGMVGTKQLSADGVMWHGERNGKIFFSQSSHWFLDVESEYEQVEAVDGLMIITQYDLPWREDIFDKWDFYDISQCFEFQKAGYKVVVPNQEKAWCLHDCGMIKLENYDVERQKFLKEYSDFLRNRIKRKIMFVNSDEIKEIDLPWAMTEMNFEVIFYQNYISMEKYKKIEADVLSNAIKHNYVDAVITHDFSQAIAQAAYENKIPYISWAWDAPLYNLYKEQAEYDTNYIFMFDKKEYEKLKKRNIPHLYYMPLASNVSYFSRLAIEEMDEEKFASNISMIAGLYDTSLLDKLSQNASKETLDAVEHELSGLFLKWQDGMSLDDKLSDEIISSVKEANGGFDSRSNSSMSARTFYETMLLRCLSHRERIALLNMLAEKHQVTLYTGSDTDELKGVDIRPRVAYDKEMPKVFHLSKINLNITMRSIQSGVPLRIFDIMAVGGFVLSNYQPELEELFIPDKEIVLFHTPEEMLEKVDFYLSHETERQQIAIAGYKKVKEKYAYPIQLKKIFDIVDEDRKAAGTK